jgi:hypothetical protein
MGCQKYCVKNVKRRIKMPYVLPERRPALNKIVDWFVEHNSNWYELISYLGEYSSVGKLTGYGPWLQEFISLASEVDLQPNGDINYILFKYCKYHVEPSYNNYKKFMGVVYWGMDYVSGNPSWRDEFREAAEWIRIKLLTPYEEKKILENGDV